jgi:hypothetical protein
VVLKLATKGQKSRKIGSRRALSSGRKDFGVELPQALSMRADEVIE